MFITNRLHKGISKLKKAKSLNIKIMKMFNSRMNNFIFVDIKVKIFL